MIHIHHAVTVMSVENTLPPLYLYIAQEEQYVLLYLFFVFFVSEILMI